VIDVVTITFGDQGENGVGMKKHGNALDKGLSVADVVAIGERVAAAGWQCEYHDLRDLLDHSDNCSGAGLLVIRNGASLLAQGSGGDVDGLLAEMLSAPFDKHKWMWGGVKNSLARWNSVFADEAIAADLINKQGTVNAFASAPILHHIRTALPVVLGHSKLHNLVAELNYYDDKSKCGIRPHGDAERKVVVAIRLGKPFPLYFRWFTGRQAVGQLLKLELRHGDMYIMSDKAVGTTGSPHRSSRCGIWRASTASTSSTARRGVKWTNRW
jgi:hypothetical protein